jgi:hypothetical protein
MWNWRWQALVRFVGVQPAREPQAQTLFPWKMKFFDRVAFLLLGFAD